MRFSIVQLSKGIARRLFGLSNFVLLGVLPYCVLLSTSVQANAQTSQELVEQLRTWKGVKLTRIPDEVLPTADEIKKFEQQQISYSELQDYYRSKITMISKHVPGLDLQAFSAGLGAFEGNRKVTSSEVHLLPYIAIVPEVALDPKTAELSALKVEIGGTTVHGVRITARLPYDRFSFAVPMQVTVPVEMTYITGVNARAMGFTHAQVIEALSGRTIAASGFEYNGLREWSEHNSHSAAEQFTKAVVLKNHAHDVPPHRYNISSHPDFALRGTLIAVAPIEMTFFLWRSEPSLLASVLGHPPPDGRLPDHILQIRIARPTGENGN